MLVSLTAPQICALVVATAGASLDLATRRISNRLTFGSWALALLVQFALGSWAGLASALCGLVTALLLCFLPLILVQLLKLFPAGPMKLGFGDVKLLAGIGAFVGPWQMVSVFLYFSFLFGACHVARLAYSMIYFGKANLRTEGKGGPLLLKPIPVGPAICAGTYLAVFLQEPTRQFLGFG